MNLTEIMKLLCIYIPLVNVLLFTAVVLHNCLMHPVHGIKLMIVTESFQHEK